MVDKPFLGELLVQREYLTPVQLQKALDIQQETKSLLGEILISLNYIAPHTLFRVISDQIEVTYAGDDLFQLSQQVDPTFLNFFSPHEMIQENFFPIQKKDHTIEIVSSQPKNPALNSLFSTRFPNTSLSCQLVTRYDLDWLINYYFRKQICFESTADLYQRTPDESATRVIIPKQVISLFIFLTLLLVWAYWRPYHILILLFTALNLFYFLNILLKFILSLAGSRYEKKEVVTESEWRNLKSPELPVYTILLPLFHEPYSVIHQLDMSIRSFDYPLEKLDVIFLIEEEDAETRQACQKDQPPYNVRFITVPSGFPQTKPRACNFGLAFARGEFLTIFDAEDIPDQDQLKKAVAAFQKYPDDYVCFQAALSFYNAHQNLLTRLFTLEYSYWFDYMLPGLFILHLPIPLGGTSNHFRTKTLRDLGGWDPFNVTEDADLGMRASYRGYKVGMLNSTTYEEATSSAKNWGTPIGQASALVLWFIFAFWLFSRTAIFSPFFPGALLYIGVFNLFLGNFLGIYLSMLAVFHRQVYGLVVFSLLNPIYWFMASIASWKAIFQLLSRPFFWEKTLHGLWDSTKGKNP
ncbi:MAG: glycosyltransferase [Candidatus Atribacteria bacterium]|nr:glycosyltransferase [Candidatus Atribacteria bacterium]